MARLAVEQLATGSTTPIASYDSTKWNLGTLIKQTLGTNPEDKYISPQGTAIARPLEESTAISVMYPHVITISSTIDWVFLIENSVAASAARRIMLYEYNKSLNTYSWRGFITVTLPTATAHTIRGFRVARYLHTSGTVSSSGTTITGSSTLFTSDRIAVGARIGFGSTDPSSITTWYNITAISSDTSLTVNTAPPTVSAGTSYVIEELRPMIVTTNATTANGGLFVAKGVNYGDFITSGTTISASTSTVDNLKLVYKLSDASTTTVTIGAGLMIDTEDSKTSHFVYIMSGTASTSIFKMNVRAAGTITSGQMVLTGSDLVITGTQVLTGVLSQTNNGRVATTSHGPGNGTKCLYFITTTRFYRADVANITSGNSSWVSDNRTEVPPGGTNTFTALGNMNSVEYIDAIDKFIITGTTGRLYVTKYVDTSGDYFEYVAGVQAYLLDSSLSDTDAPTMPLNILGTAFSVWSENGITHLCRTSASSTSMRVVTIPIPANDSFVSTSNQIAISPEISTPNNNKFYKVYLRQVPYFGNGIYRVGSDSYKLYYRTSGISDNSGSWTLVGKTGDLSSISGTSSIQFKIEFQVLSIGLGIPTRILDITVLYDDISTDSHYLPSADLSDKTTKTFAWKFATAFGTTVPTLRIRLYNAVTGSLVDDDDSATPTGTWEKSTNGTSWGAYNTTDKANDTTFIRFTPASIPDNIQVKAVLTLN